MKLPRKANIITGSLFLSSAAILIGVVYFAMNIEVIKDWTLTLPNSDIHAGDTIVVASRYTKLKQVRGTSVRSLECQSTPGIFVSYPLSKVSANRAPGNTGTGIIVTMPEQLIGVQKLPDTCRVCIALSYPVLPGRTVPYFKCTKNFTLLPVPGSQTSKEESQSLGSVSEQSNSYPNTTAGSAAVQSNNVQPAGQAQTPAQPSSSPSLLEHILQPITNLIGGL
jgi:hypothetical protein